MTVVVGATGFKHPKVSVFFLRFIYIFLKSNFLSIYQSFSLPLALLLYRNLSVRVERSLVDAITLFNFISFSLQLSRFLFLAYYISFCLSLPPSLFLPFTIQKDISFSFSFFLSFCLFFSFSIILHFHVLIFLFMLTISPCIRLFILLDNFSLHHLSISLPHTRKHTHFARFLLLSFPFEIIFASLSIYPRLVVLANHVSIHANVIHLCKCETYPPLPI